MAEVLMYKYMVVGRVLEWIWPEYRVNEEFLDNLQNFSFFLQS